MQASDHKMLEGVVASAELHRIGYERLSSRQANMRFPGFAVPNGWEAVFENRAGVLQAHGCQKAHVDLARGFGAELHFGEALCSWRRETDRYVVTTNMDQHTSPKLILCLGLWTCEKLTDLGLPLSGRRIPIIAIRN